MRGLYTVFQLPYLAQIPCEDLSVIPQGLDLGV